jgi:outer membrane lipoprotein carrier protein
LITYYLFGFLGGKIMLRLSILTFGTALILNLPVYPESTADDTLPAVRETEAVKAMKKAYEFYQSAKSLSIEFTADVYWLATETWNKSEGALWLREKDEFHLFLPEMEMISDGKMLWKYSKENKQVVLENYEGSSTNAHPSQILFKFLKCNPVSLDTIREEKQSYLKISMDVQKDLKEYDSLDVYLHLKSFKPYKICTVDAAENKSIYTVHKIKRNVAFKKKAFQFSVPKGVELVDLTD